MVYSLELSLLDLVCQVGAPMRNAFTLWHHVNVFWFSLWCPAADLPQLYVSKSFPGQIASLIAKVTADCCSLLLQLVRWFSFSPARTGLSDWSTGGELIVWILALEPGEWAMDVASTDIIAEAERPKRMFAEEAKDRKRESDWARGKQVNLSTICCTIYPEHTCTLLLLFALLVRC